jgi:PKD domain
MNTQRCLRQEAVFLVVVLFAFAAVEELYADVPDVLIVGSATTTHTFATVPLYIRDTSGTTLDADSVDRIQHIEFRIVFSQPALIVGCASQTIPQCAVTFVPAGVLAGRSALSITEIRGSASIYVRAVYSSSSNPLPFTVDADAPGDLFGHLEITFTEPHNTAFDLRLVLDPNVTRLAAQPIQETKTETFANGTLRLVSGTVGFGSTCDSPPSASSIGWQGVSSGCQTGGSSSCLPGETILFRVESEAVLKACDAAYWTFPDKTIASGAEVDHQLLTPGLHRVALTLTNRLGETDATAQVFVTLPAGCPLPATQQVSIGWTGSQGCVTGAPCAAGELIAFRIETLDHSFQGCESFAWTFGDGSTSTAKNPLKTYMAANTYAVSLTIRSPSFPGEGRTVPATIIITERGRRRSVRH